MWFHLLLQEEKLADFLIIEILLGLFWLAGSINIQVCARASWS